MVKVKKRINSVKIKERYKIGDKSFIRKTKMSFVDILKFEGRLHNIDRCMICSQRIEDENINLIKGFLPTHTHCSNSFLISKKEADELFKFSSTLNLNDKIVEGLYKIVLKGTGI